MFAGQPDLPVRIDDIRALDDQAVACPPGGVTLVADRQSDVHRVADTHRPNEPHPVVTLENAPSLILLAGMLVSTLRISMP